MTTRSRTRTRPRGGTTYTARLHQRTAAPRRARRRQPAWLTSRTVPALLTLCAELAHLAAAVVEWPAAPARGLFHVLVAAGLGLLTVTVYFGHSTMPLVPGIALTLAVPTTWLTGAPLGLSPYQDYPLLAAVVLTVLELTVTGMLTAHRLAR